MPLTPAQRAKRYRENNKEEVRKRENLRKKQHRVTLKCVNPIANKERLEKQKIAKALYRKRKLEEAIKAKESTNTSSPSSKFSNTAIRARSLKKAADALPKSPRKKVEIVKSLAKQFHLKVKYTNIINKGGRPNSTLTEIENEWLNSFFERPDITYTTPGMKDQKYLGKVNGESTFAQKRYLLWSLQDITGILNQNDNGDGESFSSRFSKNITFRQLYGFVKSQPQLIYNRDISQSSCLCEICENIVYIAKTLLKQNGHALPQNPHDLVGQFACNSMSRKCMYDHDCAVCQSMLLNENDFDLQLANQQVLQWQKIDKKVQKSTLDVTFDELIEMFNAQIQVLKKHIFVKREQNKFYNNLKENLERNSVLIHVDYSENYSNKEQQEIQSAYFGHETFSIFTACCYFLGVDNKLTTKNVTITSEATDHSRIAAHTCVIRVLEEVTKEMPGISRLYLWSDGCAAQFRSRFVFDLISRMDKKYDVTWCYNERHHGKGPMDGIGGTVKNKVFRDVKSGKVKITCAESFAEYADKAVNGIRSIYLAKHEILKEPSNIENAPKIYGTLEVHMVTRVINEDGVCKLRFFKMATDDKPFYQHWYRREGDPEVCDHPALSLAYDQDNTCATCKAPYHGQEDWLKCHVCEQWFHERCFMI